MMMEGIQGTCSTKNQGSTPGIKVRNKHRISKEEKVGRRGTDLFGEVVVDDTGEGGEARVQHHRPHLSHHLLFLLCTPRPLLSPVRITNTLIERENERERERGLTGAVREGEWNRLERVKRAVAAPMLSPHIPILSLSSPSTSLVPFFCSHANTASASLDSSHPADNIDMVLI